ncbi:hypothetical protein [Dysosmobacter segnis]|uniref:Uncharacterized protein n=2 Tax=Dysosmobacter TaxID=2591381 RepID=A0A923MHR1_9FIRM|nr:hypothetical protein [Dysosmobacter segnis]MBC5770236.1 hypothetical protein [Dysosmobacter segnis]
MMYAVLSLGLALLGGGIRLAQMLRLSVPLLYGALVITVFRPWYLAHIALADGIFLVLVGLAVLSWMVTLVRVVWEMIW